MKWALLVLACVSLFVGWQVGHLSRTVEVKESKGYSQQQSSAAAAAAADIEAGYTGGAIAAGLIGCGAVLGAALIQVSENKRKD
ncbi:MAG: hypothetical protein ACYSUT_10155 [Planctomycetota bacterium]|jgi:hypothetical protein